MTHCLKEQKSLKLMQVFYIQFRWSAPGAIIFKKINLNTFKKPENGHLGLKWTKKSILAVKITLGPPEQG